ncbi:hypothetical protein TNCT_728451 [Trichonephila clavata]|uniref:Uncharacterized protein n=1 Tax=Trichonephila clavata TaxID=2740835 RepID=A0A8X6J1E8_TRICU|nr:hypothetical protein TNCT_728451 [Trichonephila clavata]
MSNKPNENEVPTAHLDAKFPLHMILRMRLRTAATVRMAGCSILSRYLEQHRLLTVTILTMTVLPADMLDVELRAKRGVEMMDILR